MAHSTPLQQHRALLAATMLPRTVQTLQGQLGYRYLAVIAWVISKITTFTKEVDFGTEPGSILAFSLGFGSRIPRKLWAVLPLFHICSYVRGITFPKCLSNNRFKTCGLDAFGFFCGQLPTPFLTFLHHVTIFVRTGLSPLRDRGGLGALKQCKRLKSLTFVLEPTLPEPLDTACGQYLREILDALQNIFFERELVIGDSIVALSITGCVATFATEGRVREALSMQPEERDPTISTLIINSLRLILQSQTRNRSFVAERKQAIVNRRQWMSANGVPFPPP
ncbi:uncharacterized protein BDZ99DRAFT_514115 [Mytilinidion resinicola]|uniref:Uncharacterized protein n=1 Tax=Mytilinidion resinicola TaxID=574789 RepID=A0A6A6ZC59_9PEZI|nr:uncharacterized protein BDZ99DRAFT_514115 [Mytilinidion resinicola]KAF2817895.1 hypothetical protein BDZ99DRAFT_514115 [Mytilinidion resinicola]